MHFQTLYIVLQAAMAIQTLGLLLSWLQNRQETGLRDWSLSAGLMAIGGLLLVIGRMWTAAIPEADWGPALLLQDMGSAAANAGMALAWIGIRGFFHMRTPSYRWVVVYGLALLVVLVPLNHIPGWRTAVGGFSFGLLSAMVFLEIVRQKAERNLIIHVSAVAMGLVALFWLLRGFYAMHDMSLASGSRLIDKLCVFSSILSSLTFTISLILITNRRMHQQLRELAATDPLTGAMNRRAFYNASQPLLAAMKRDESQLAVALLDLDHFKQLNDRYGHDAGDRVLEAFSSLISRKLRDGDLFARYGGEEFVLLLQHSSSEQALQAMKRLQEACRQLVVDAGGERLSVHFSAGVCCVTGRLTNSLDDLLKCADIALYQAKDGGRDRIVLTVREQASREPGGDMMSGQAITIG